MCNLQVIVLVKCQVIGVEGKDSDNYYQQDKFVVVVCQWDFIDVYVEEIGDDVNWQCEDGDYCQGIEGVIVLFQLVGVNFFLQQIDVFDQV